jgi:hypothetical protein
MSLTLPVTESRFSHSAIVEEAACFSDAFLAHPTILSSTDRRDHQGYHADTHKGSHGF